MEYNWKSPPNGRDEWRPSSPPKEDCRAPTPPPPPDKGVTTVRIGRKTKIAVAVVVGLVILGIIIGPSETDTRTAGSVKEATTTTAAPTTTTQVPTTTTTVTPTTTTKAPPTTRPAQVSQREIDVTSFTITVRSLTSAGPMLAAQSDADLIRLGDSICKAFDKGVSFWSLVSSFDGTPADAVAYSEIVGAAAGTMCERHMSKVPGSGR